MSDARWLDLTAAAAYLSLRPDIFARKVKAGVIPAPSGAPTTNPVALVSWRYYGAPPPTAGTTFMSATQTAETAATTTQRPSPAAPSTKTGNGAKLTRAKSLRAKPATAIRTDPPGQSSASRTAAATAAQAAARKARAEAAGIAAQMGRTAAGPSALASPVILDLVRMLPAPSPSFTQQKCIVWMEAFGACLRAIYGFQGAISVSGSPAT
jgi:hypothetical protein